MVWRTRWLPTATTFLAAPDAADASLRALVLLFEASNGSSLAALVEETLRGIRVCARVVCPCPLLRDAGDLPSVVGPSAQAGHGDLPLPQGLNPQGVFVFSWPHTPLNHSFPVEARAPRGPAHMRCFACIAIEAQARPAQKPSHSSHAAKRTF